MQEQDFARIKSVTQYLKIFFRRKWFIIIPAFVGLVLGIAAIFLIPPTYESHALIIVEEEKIINPLIQGLAVSTSAAQRMESIKERLLSWNNLEELSRKLDLIKNNPSQRQLEGLIAGLKSNISVSMRGENLIRIAYEGGNPKQAQLIAKTMTDLLVEENKRSQAKETEAAINFIQAQLEVYKSKIKESEIAQMEDQLRTLLVDSTEEHPLVIELRQKIAAARKQLDSGDFKVAPAGKSITGPAYEGLKQELDKIITTGTPATQAISGAESVEPTANLSKLVLMDKIDSVMARDISVNENIYNILLQKLETAKITQRLEASKQGTRYNIVDPPLLPLKPIKPNKIATIFLGLFLGAASGVGLVFIREFTDHSFLDIEDAKNNLQLPLLGAISRLTTQEEIDKEALRIKKLVKLGLSSTAAFLIIVALVSFLRR